MLCSYVMFCYTYKSQYVTCFAFQQSMKHCLLYIFIFNIDCRGLELEKYLVKLFQMEVEERV